VSIRNIEPNALTAEELKAVEVLQKDSIWYGFPFEWRRYITPRPFGITFKDEVGRTVMALLFPKPDYRLLVVHQASANYQAETSLNDKGFGLLWKTASDVRPLFLSRIIRRMEELVGAIRFGHPSYIQRRRDLFFNMEQLALNPKANPDFQKMRGLVWNILDSEGLVDWAVVSLMEEFLKF